MPVFNDVTLFIKTLRGTTFKIQASLTQTVEELKASINEQEGFDIEKQRLIFQGKCLEDDKSLNDYNVSNEVAMHLVIRG